MSRKVEAHIVYTGIISFYKDADEDVWVLTPDGSTDHDMPHLSWLKVSPHCSDCSELEEINHEEWPSPVYRANGHMELDGIVDSHFQAWQRWPFTENNLVPLSNSSVDPRVNLLDLKHVESPDVTPEVALRTKISRGKLDVSCVNARRKWAFTHLGADQPRYLAQVVCHQVRLKHDTLRLEFRQGNHVRTVEVRGNLKSPVIVQIGNTMCRDVFPKQSDVEEEIDYHVKLYAKLSRHPGAVIGPLVSRVVSNIKDPWLLHLHKVGVGIVAQGPNCPPGNWEVGESGD